jgi:WD40 repeat protein
MRRILLFAVILLLGKNSYSQLRILMPNGGERYKVGSNAIITWTGNQPGDTMTIEYSTNNGTTWSLITNKGLNGFYQWNNVPNTPSAQCLLRITSGATSTDSIIFLPAQNGANFESIAHADFSPDGKRVAGASVEGNIFIWDSFTKQVLHIIPVQTPADVGPGIDVLTFVEYSPDGKYIATITPIKGSGDNNVWVYDATTYALVSSWRHNSKNISGNQNTSLLEISSDSKRLIVCAEHPTIYDIATGNAIGEIHGYYDSIISTFSYKMLHARWTKDDSRIVSIRTDGWQSGGKRAVFLNDVLSLDTIYTRDAHPTAISTHSISLNPSDTRFITMANDGLMNVWDLATGSNISSTNPYGLYPYDSEYSKDGKYFVTVGQEAFGANGAVVKLFDAVTNAFIKDIGKLGVGWNVDYNNDDTRIAVANGSNVAIFQAPTAAQSSDVSDSLWEIYLDLNPTVTVSAPKVSARMNTAVNVPITLDDPVGARAAGATRVDLTLRYNVSLLAPTGATPKGTIIGKERELMLSLPIPTNGDNILTTLTFKAALGNDSVTTLDIMNPISDNINVTVVDSDGVFTLLDLCRDGGARLLNPDGITSISKIHPNPASGIVQAEIKTIEKGITTLTLYDVMGREVRKYIDGAHEPIDERRTLDVSGVSQGRYVLVLRTPTVTRTYPIEVTK